MDQIYDYDDDDYSVSRGEDELSDDEEPKPPAITQRDMEHIFPDTGRMTLTSEEKEEVLDLPPPPPPPQKERIRYTPNSEAEVINDLPQREFRKKESLVGRKFKKFTMHGGYDLVGENISGLEVGHLPFFPLQPILRLT
jgi:hypothetical protein